MVCYLFLLNMQRLLEETLLFDNSLQHPDLSYGDPWSNIQNKMNKILLKPNSLQSHSPDYRPNLSSKHHTKSNQNLRNAHVSPENSIRSSSSPKVTPTQQINFQKDQNFKLKKRLPQIISRKNKIKQVDKFAQHISLMKMQLVLLQKNDKINHYSKKEIQIESPKNKIVYHQNFYKQSNRNPVKKDQFPKNQKQQNLIKKDLTKLICTKQIFNCQNDSIRIHNLQKNKINQSQLLDDTHISGIIPLINKIEQKNSKKGSFQSLGNVLNAQNKTGINPKRRSSIQKPFYKIQPQKIKTVSISFKRDIKDNKSPLCVMGPVEQIVYNPQNNNSLDKSHHDQNQGHLKTLISSTSNKNLLENEVKQNSISEHSDSIFYKKQSSRYQSQISELKKLLKNHQDKKRKITIEKVNLINDLHLPLLKSRAQSLNSETRKSFRTPSKKFSIASISRKCTNLKFKSQTQRPNQIPHINQRENTNNVELNFILSKDKKKSILRSGFKKESKKEENSVQQEQIIKSNGCRKVSLSQVLTGKFKIENFSSKPQCQRKGVSKSYHFTNYKSLENCKQMGKQNNDRPDKKLQTFKESSKLKSQSINLSSNQKRFPGKLFNEKTRDQINSYQLDSIGRLITKRKKLALLESQSRVLLKKDMEQKDETKWYANSFSGKDRQKMKTEFSLKKNLNAEQNISLFKLSLNRNKNTLVIIRR